MLKSVLDNQIAKIKQMSPRGAQEYLQKVFYSPLIDESSRRKLIMACDEVIATKPQHDPMVVKSEIN